MDLFGISNEMTSLGSNGKDAQLSGLNEQDRYNFLPNVDFQNLNISFNGCGFLGIYHIGVATALKTYVPDFRIENISGASAGAVAAVCLLGGVETGKHNISFFIHCLSFIYTIYIYEIRYKRSTYFRSNGSSNTRYRSRV